MFKKILLCVIGTLTFGNVYAAWDFRGEPNNWGSSRMTSVPNDANRFIIRQSFSATQSAFKIAKDAGWVESYPAQNFKVAPGKTYDITFFQNTHVIQVAEVMVNSSSSSLQASSKTSSAVSSITNSKSSTSSLSSKSSSLSSTANSSVASSEKWLFRGTPNNWDTNIALTKSGNLFVTCQDFAANDPRFKISNGNKLAPNSWVEAYPAQDFRVAVNTSFDITFDSKTKVITVTPRTSLCGSIDVQRSLFVHDEATLNVSDTSGPLFSLRRVLQQLANQLNVQNPTHPTSAGELFARMWDSQNSPESAVFLNGPKCTGVLNGFPNECRFAEGFQARSPEDAINNYVPVALVNRFDLHDANFNNCGEYRIIYAVKNSQGRNFIIFEAQLGNPVKTDRQMCLPVVNFWKNLSNVNDAATRAQLLSDFYFKGLANNGDFPTVGPVVDIGNYTGTAGQIRTNEFMGNSWLLKEFKVAITDGISLFMPVTTKSNPFGQLFNDGARTDNLAVEFRTQFLNNMGSLLIPDLSAFSLTVQNDAHNNGQSHASGDTSENDFLGNTNQGTGVFKAAIQSRAIQLGSTLTADQILNRATAMTCGGCHQLSAFTDVGATQPWPSTLGFTHISEFAVNGVFPMSPALQNVFLPARKAGMEAFLKSFNGAPAASITPAMQGGEQPVIIVPGLTGKRSG